MSDRSYFLNIKQWEIDCLKDVAEQLKQENMGLDNMNFYYSFQIPKLGKEFDLLKITEDYVINVELKSGDVTDEKIKKQLLRNRYYLASLGKIIRSYTYIRDENRLVRLTNSENLLESDFGKLSEDIIQATKGVELYKNTKEYLGDIEVLFKEEKYIISPLTDPERFLRRDYFLTSQQNDIRNHILKVVKEKTGCFLGFTGLPGTGKTLLLYDLAMGLSYKQKVCVLHFGSYPEELEKLDERLKRIDFYKCKDGSIKENGINDCFGNLIPMDDYQSILIDEGHRISKEFLLFIKNYATANNKPVIFSYDNEDAIAFAERENDPVLFIENIPEFIKYKLTNRIRLNVELSSFINCLMMPAKYRRRSSYPNISVEYANDESEAISFIEKYVNDGYVYISKKNIENDTVTTDEYIRIYKRLNAISSEKATCKEYDKIIMRIGKAFYYDEDGFLRYNKSYVSESPVKALFHGLNRAKQKITLVIDGNDALLDTILHILQGDTK